MYRYLDAGADSAMKSHGITTQVRQHGPGATNRP